MPSTATPKQIEVYDTPSGLGGSFAVSIEKDLGETVEARVWYGRPTHQGWEAWKDWDGYCFTTERSKLTNRRMQALSL